MIMGNMAIAMASNGITGFAYLVFDRAETHGKLFPTGHHLSRAGKKQGAL